MATADTKIRAAPSIMTRTKARPIPQTGKLPPILLRPAHLLPLSSRYLPSTHGRHLCSGPLAIFIYWAALLEYEILGSILYNSTKAPLLPPCLRKDPVRKRRRRVQPATVPNEPQAKRSQATTRSSHYCRGVRRAITVNRIRAKRNPAALSWARKRSQAMTKISHHCVKLPKLPSRRATSLHGTERDNHRGGSNRSRHFRKVSWCQRSPPVPLQVMLPSHASRQLSLYVIFQA